MKIPVDTRKIKEKLMAVKTDETDTTVLDKQRRDGSDAAKERAKRKKLEEEYNNEKTSSTRKDEIIEEMKASLETTQATLAERDAELEKLRPIADRATKNEHKERMRIINSLPSEMQGRAKKMSEKLDDLEDFKDWATPFKGGSQGEGEDVTTKGGKTDWSKLMEGNDQKALDEAIKKDTAGFNTYMDELGKVK